MNIIARVKMYNKYFVAHYVILFFVMVICSSTSYSCDGGVMPYIPTNSGTNSSPLSGQIFLFEKGVAGDLFNTKKLQPLLRNIINSGNERKSKKPSSAKKQNNSANEEENTSKNVLNWHRLH